MSPFYFLYVKIIKYKSINISFVLIPIFWTVLQKWFRTLLSSCLSKINPRFSFVKGSKGDDKDKIFSDCKSSA